MSYCVISTKTAGGELDRRTSHTLPSRIQFSQAGLSSRQSHCNRDREIGTFAALALTGSDKC